MLQTCQSGVMVQHLLLHVTVLVGARVGGDGGKIYALLVAFVGAWRFREQNLATFGNIVRAKKCSGPFAAERVFYVSNSSPPDPFFTID